MRVIRLPRSMARSPVLLRAGVNPGARRPVWSEGFAAVLALVWVGCMAGREPRDPREALHAYGTALREGRTADAYALLSRDVQTRVSLPEFRRMVSENAREIEEISAALLRPAQTSELTATVTSPDGD